MAKNWLLPRGHRGDDAPHAGVDSSAPVYAVDPARPRMPSQVVLMGPVAPGSSPGSRAGSALLRRAASRNGRVPLLARDPRAAA